MCTNWVLRASTPPSQPQLMGMTTSPPSATPQSPCPSPCFGHPRPLKWTCPPTTTRCTSG